MLEAVRFIWHSQSQAGRQGDLLLPLTLQGPLWLSSGRLLRAWGGSPGVPGAWPPLLYQAPVFRAYTKVAVVEGAEGGGDTRKDTLPSLRIPDLRG